MLNPKQEQFVLNLVNGMSQRQAYKDAYNAKYKEEAIDNKASKLFNKDEVQVRYRELLKQIKTEKGIMSATERMEWLTGVLKGEVMDSYTWDGEERETVPSMANKLKAMDILNKMSGEYTTNHKISGDPNNPVSIVDLSHLSTEEIRELLKNEDKE